MTTARFSHRITAAAALALAALAAPAAHAAVVAQTAAPISFTGNADNQATGLFSAAQTGDLYIAMTVRLEAGDLGANNFLALWLDNATGGAHTNRPNVGLKSNEGSPGGLDWMVRGSGTAGSFSPDQAHIGDTTTLWAHLYKAGNTNYNRYDLWVNPTGSWTDVLATTPEARSTLNSGVGSVSVFGFRTANLSGSDRFTVQSMMISNTVPVSLAQVSAVPEPGSISLVLAGLGVVGAMARRRRTA